MSHSRWFFYWAKCMRKTFAAAENPQTGLRLKINYAGPGGIKIREPPFTIYPYWGPGPAQHRVSDGIKSLSPPKGREGGFTKIIAGRRVT